jgi:hypothetical protein
MDPSCTKFNKVGFLYARQGKNNMSKRNKPIKKGERCNKCGVFSPKVRYVGFDSKFVGFYFLCPECLKEEEDRYHIVGYFSDTFYTQFLSPVSKV